MPQITRVLDSTGRHVGFIEGRADELHRFGRLTLYAPPRPERWFLEQYSDFDVCAEVETITLRGEMVEPGEIVAVTDEPDRLNGCFHFRPLHSTV